MEYQTKISITDESGEMRADLYVLRTRYMANGQLMLLQEDYRIGMWSGIANYIAYCQETKKLIFWEKSFSTGGVLDKTDHWPIRKMLDRIGEIEREYGTEYIFSDLRSDLAQQPYAVGRYV